VCPLPWSNHVGNLVQQVTTGPVLLPASLEFGGSGTACAARRSRNRPARAPAAPRSLPHAAATMAVAPARDRLPRRAESELLGRDAAARSIPDPSKWLDVTRTPGLSFPMSETGRRPWTGLSRRRTSSTSGGSWRRKRTRPNAKN
jgi:hypothetical protein